MQSTWEKEWRNNLNMLEESAHTGWRWSLSDMWMICCWNEPLYPEYLFPIPALLIFGPVLLQQYLWTQKPKGDFCYLF